MTAQEHAEIKRLRRELSEVKEERDILKKATDWARLRDPSTIGVTNRCFAKERA
jgi:transposase-like protein